VFPSQSLVGTPFFSPFSFVSFLVLGGLVFFPIFFLFLSRSYGVGCLTVFPFFCRHLFTDFFPPNNDQLIPPPLFAITPCQLLDKNAFPLFFPCPLNRAGRTMQFLFLFTGFRDFLLGGSLPLFFFKMAPSFPSFSTG